MKKYLILILILADLVWSVTAFVYDFPVIREIPWYFLPFIVICPVYPFLLATIWFSLLKKNETNIFLFAFAAIPSFIYMIGAIIYYPAWMIFNGFDLRAFGQISWVAFYGLQGLYLLIKYKILLFPALIVLIFLLISFFIQYQTQTFGYLDFSNFGTMRLISYIFFSIFTSLFFLLIQKKQVGNWNRKN